MVKGGHAWQGACVVKGGMHGEGGMHGKGGMCGEGRHAIRKGEACVVCMPPFYEIRPVNARVVRILLECILVYIVMDMIWYGGNLEQHPLIKMTSSFLKTFKGSPLIITLAII